MARIGHCPVDELAGHFLGEMIERLKVDIVDAKATQEFPDSLDGIELGAVGRQMIERERLGHRWLAMIGGIVHDEHVAATAVSVASHLLQKDPGK